MTLKRISLLKLRLDWTIKKDARGTIVRLYNPMRSERTEASIDNKTVELKTCQFEDLRIDK